jgi:hypothetical protein
VRHWIALSAAPPPEWRAVRAGVGKPSDRSAVSCVWLPRGQLAGARPVFLAAETILKLSVTAAGGRGCTGMQNIFLAGGFPMVFILVFGAAAIALASSYAFTLRQGRKSGALWTMLATLLATLAGVALDMAATCNHITSAASVNVQALLTGLGESLSPAILGCTLLAVAALITAIGVQRVKLA